MLEDGKIRSSLIWDESCLNNTRTCVAWLSPNYWSNGSRYGNIMFRFDWRQLIEGKKFFWVEAIEKYRPPAFRILITEKDTFAPLEPYAVEEYGGPLFHDHESDIWYWNGQLTGEFMIDQDLPLRDCIGIQFCNHHRSMCGKEGSSCGDLGQVGPEAGLRLLALAVGTGVVNHLSRQRELFMENGRLETSARLSRSILRSQRKCSVSGQVTASNKEALPLASAVLERIGRGQDPCRLASLFKTVDDLELALRKRMAKAFGIPLQDLPEPADEI